MAAIVALSFVAFMIYRIGAVYTVRAGKCSPPGKELSLQQMELRREGDRILSYPRRPAASARAGSVRVATYNIEGHAALVDRRHLEEVAQVIRDLQPDVIALQEVHRGTWQSRFTDQLSELERLTRMTGFFGKSFKALGGEFGNAVMTRGRIESAEVHELPSVGEPRSLLRATVAVDGRRINVFVTHLATWGRLNRASRMEQIECIEQIIARSELPFILAGDFNATETTSELATMFRNSHISADPQASGGTHRLTRQKLDYIFPDAGWKPRFTRVVFAGDSDHWPVIAELNELQPAQEKPLK